MPDTLDSLILDLIEWIGPSSRPYSEVIEAWRTSCPRLPVWEEANDRGFVTRRRLASGGELVVVTDAGDDYLREHRRSRTPEPIEQSGGVTAR